MSGFKLGTRHVGDGDPCFIMAEVGQAHEGSLGMAHAYIDAVAKAGVDAVKFQCHLGDDTDEWRVEPEWKQDETRLDYWRRTGFTPDQWWGLMAHANAQGLEFLCSPFSVEAVKMLEPMVEAWKVPSGEITNGPLLKAIAETGKPVIASLGMATNDEIDEMDWADAVLKCTSLYPCPPGKIGLTNTAGTWGILGFSDHSGTIYAGLAAAVLGHAILEVHVCFSKEQYGFDVSSSITIEQLGQLVEGVRFIEKAKTPVDKDALAKELEPMRELFMGKHKRKEVKCQAVADGTE